MSIAGNVIIAIRLLSIILRHGRNVSITYSGGFVGWDK